MNKFKVDDYFYYDSNFPFSIHYWTVCIITKLSDDIAYNYTQDNKKRKCRNYHYRVIRSGGSSWKEPVGYCSKFTYGSAYHRECIKVKDINDSWLLAKVM